MSTISSNTVPDVGVGEGVVELGDGRGVRGDLGDLVGSDEGSEVVVDGIDVGAVVAEREADRDAEGVGVPVVWVGDAGRLADGALLVGDTEGVLGAGEGVSVDELPAPPAQAGRLDSSGMPPSVCAAAPTTPMATRTPPNTTRRRAATRPLAR